MSELNLSSPVQTNEEAVRFLRLDQDYSEPDNAVKAWWRGFNFRQFAAALNPELLAKLHTPRPLATKKRGGSEGSKP